MRIVVDRFEGNYAVCEKQDGSMIDIEKSKLPIEAKIGDVFDILDGNVILNKTEKEKRKKEIEELTKDIWI